MNIYSETGIKAFICITKCLFLGNIFVAFSIHKTKAVIKNKRIVKVFYGFVQLESRSCFASLKLSVKTKKFLI